MKKVLLFAMPTFCLLLFQLGTDQVQAESIHESHLLAEPTLTDLFQETVQGQVVDAATEDPLPGVSIVLQGTTTGTSTDIEGNFELNLPQLEGVLEISYIGYETVQIDIDGRSSIDVSLQQTAIEGEDVIVVGYGTQERINLTGSVGAVRGDALENRPIANVGEGLQGLVPNLNVSVPSGDPADSPRFNIRGYESINGGSPLILVDGIPMDINSINPSDIESISVLKDAAAAAVYGARGAFGVILVETKSGRTGEALNVSLNTQWSMARPIFNMDPVTDPHQFILARNMATTRTNGTPQYDETWLEGTRRWVENPTHENAWEVVDGSLRYYGYNDYQNQLMTDYSPTQQHDLSISGGSENSAYYLSAGYMNKEGYLRDRNANEKFRRYNVLLDVDFMINDWLNLGERIQFSSENSNKPHFYNWDVNINSLARVSPIMPVQFPDLDYYLEPGDRGNYEQFIGMYFGGPNFYPYLMDGGRETYTNNDLWLTQEVNISPLANLNINTDFSYNIFNRNYQDVASKIDIVSTDLTNIENMVSHGFSDDDWIDARNNYNQEYIFNIYAEYVLDRFESHSITAMVGFNQEWSQNRYMRSQARSLLTPQITNLNATVGNQQVSGSSSHVALRGAFYRLNYVFRDRYLIEANGRYDGTSRFPEDDRFGFFPSFSAGWIISNENFMAGTSGFLEMLKIRASYGTLGNQLLGSNYYPYISSMGIGNSSFIMSSGQTPYVSAPGLVSPTLTWEKVTSRNLGVDVTMFGGMLDLVFDIYTRDTKDMLMGVDYPVILGTGAPSENAADLRTSGWELEVTWRHAVNNDLQYSVAVGLSDWVAEITKYDNPNNSLSDYYVGQRIGEIWGYETVGIFQNEEQVANAADQSQLGANWRPGDIQYADLNGDGRVTPGSNTLDDPGDRRVIGNSQPRYSFGITPGLTYRNFSFSLFFQGVMQRDYWPSSGNWTQFFPFNQGHVENYYITDTWSEDNRDAYFPAPHISTNDKKNLQVQSRYLQNAAYVRLKNLMISYNLPQSLIDRVGLGQLQIYLSGMNLWEYAPIYGPLDPEFADSGQSSYQSHGGAIVYPMQRVFTIGTRISL